MHVDPPADDYADKLDFGDVPPDDDSLGHKEAVARDVARIQALKDKWAGEAADAAKAQSS